MRTRPIARMTSFAPRPCLLSRAAIGDAFNQHASIVCSVGQSGTLRAPDESAPHLRHRHHLARQSQHSHDAARLRESKPARLFSPMRSRPMVFLNSPAFATWRPLIDVITSPALMPALSAGEPSMTCDTSAPRALSRPRLLGDAGREVVGKLHAEHAALHFAVLTALRHHGLHHVGRNGEADADVAASCRRKWRY